LSRSFLLSEALTEDALAARLQALGVPVYGRGVPFSRLYLDTFDWRLHREGLVFEELIEGRSVKCLLRPADGGAAVATLPGEAPRFARDLPPGPLRERLDPLLSPRALLPLAIVGGTALRLTLLSPGGGIVARFLLERRAVLPIEGGRDFTLPTVITVTSGRGAAAASALLLGMPELRPVSADLIGEILAPLGRRPRDYSGKVKVKLDPAMPARGAITAILRNLLETMERNIPGLREDVDPEFLHDFRVAVRRTRSAIGQLKGVLPAATVARFSGEFRWLQEATGPTRDLDVYLLTFPALAELVSPAHRRSLGPLLRHLGLRRAEAFAAMMRELDSQRLARLLAGWRGVLDRPVPKRPGGTPNALLPVREIAGRRIGKLHRRALQEGSGITATSPATKLHELRKTCKKLRYLLEFFQSVLDEEGAARFIGSLKGLQDNLGRIQDLQVEADSLVGYARELAKEGRVKPSAYLAMGMLVERLREEQRVARHEFGKRFGEFGRARNRRELRRLIKFQECALPEGAPAAPDPAEG
jgi:CHAD domain-containing protein